MSEPKPLPQIYPRIQAAQQPSSHRARPLRARGALLPSGPFDAARYPVPDSARPESPCAGHYFGSAVGQGGQQPAVPGRRCTPSVAQSDVQGIHAPSDPAPARHHGRRDERSGRSSRRRGPLRRRHRPCAPLSRPDHLRVARRAPRGLETVLVVGRRCLQGLHLHRRCPRNRAGRHARVAASSTTTSTRWRTGAGTA